MAKRLTDPRATPIFTLLGTRGESPEWNTNLLDAFISSTESLIGQGRFFKE